MPLAFPSLSHGTIAFGFFNIEVDMLLLQDLFFFADRFCQAVCQLERQRTATLDGFVVPPARAGNVNLAIAGDHTGFIGATYRVWPFPSSPEGFKQKPYGQRNQAEAEALMADFGAAKKIPVSQRDEVQIGDYRFAPEAFASLIDYVDRGGYPRWQDEVRPPYVKEMMTQLEAR